MAKGKDYLISSFNFAPFQIIYRILSISYLFSPFRFADDTFTVGEARRSTFGSWGKEGGRDTSRKWLSTCQSPGKMSYTWKQLLRLVVPIENLFYKRGLKFSTRAPYRFLLVLSLKLHASLGPSQLYFISNAQLNLNKCCNTVIFSNVWLEKLYNDTRINYIFRLELTDHIVFQDISLNSIF